MVQVTSKAFVENIFLPVVTQKSIPPGVLFVPKGIQWLTVPRTKANPFL